MPKEPLSERDYLNMLAGVRRAHEAAADPGRLPLVMLQVIRGLVPVEHLTYNEVDLGAQRLVSFSDTPAHDAALLPYAGAWERHMDEHPVLQDDRRRAERAARPAEAGRPARAAGEPVARKISDFLPRRRYRELGLYRECYRHLDTEFQMVLTLVAGEGRTTVGIALNRKLRDFSERDRRVLELCGPHLRAAHLDASRRLRLRRLFDPGEEGRAVEDLRRLLGLTRREAQVMFHVLQGKTNPQIGAALSNSPRTVHKHLEHVFAKLGVSGRAAAIGEAIRRAERAPCE